MNGHVGEYPCRIGCYRREGRSCWGRFHALMETPLVDMRQHRLNHVVINSAYADRFKTFLESL